MDQTLEVPKVAVDPTPKLSIRVGDKTKHEIKTAFDGLISERKNWEQNEYARSNQKLYEIFQKCYALYLEMKGVTAEKLALKRAFNTYCTDNGVKYKDSTHLMVKIAVVYLLMPQLYGLQMNSWCHPLVFQSSFAMPVALKRFDARRTLAASPLKPKRLKVWY